MAWYERFLGIKPVRTMEELTERVEELGFLPMFACGITGFSVSEINAHWWPKDNEGDDDGPWEWKGPMLREGRVAYGKFCLGKAAFVSRDLFADFINWRRSLRLAKNDDVAALDDVVWQAVEAEGPITIKELRALLGLGGSKRRRTADDLVDDAPVQQKLSLDPILTRLQMGGRVTIADFVYNIDKKGNAYGWGIAKYTTPERMYGIARAGCTPQESLDRLVDRLRSSLPAISEDAARLVISGGRP